MKNDIEETLKWLESVSVRFRPKSMNTFERVLEFTQLFEQLSADEISELILNISDEVAKKFLSFSAFFAELALTTGEVKWIKGAIFLHILEDFRKDYRENFRYLILVAYGATQLKVDFSKMVDGVLHTASTRTRDYLVGFVGREQELNELNKYGIKVEVVNNQTRFIQI